MRPFVLPSVAAILLTLPAGVGAQSRKDVDRVPVSMLPPAGLCRIWMTGVPAAQQPAPTDCATALRQRPTNGVVLYGPAPREPENARFDPRVGERATAKKGGRGADSLRTGGSAAERALADQQERLERQRRYNEIREREDAARRALDARAGLNTRAAGGARAIGPAAKGGESGGASGGAGGVSAATGAGASAKAPADPKPANPKKPE